MLDLSSTICMHVTGKCAVSYILSLYDNILTLVPFIEPRRQKDHDTKLTKSSVSSRYVAILILQLLKSESQYGAESWLMTILLHVLIYS